jgi:hypothetical protein
VYHRIKQKTIIKTINTKKIITMTVNPSTRGNQKVRIHGKYFFYSPTFIETKVSHIYTEEQATFPHSHMHSIAKIQCPQRKSVLIS